MDIAILEKFKIGSLKRIVQQKEILKNFIDNSQPILERKIVDVFKVSEGKELPNDLVRAIQDLFSVYTDIRKSINDYKVLDEKLKNAGGEKYGEFLGN